MIDLENPKKDRAVDDDDAAVDAGPAAGAGPLVAAAQIALTEERGHMFGPLDLDLESGGVTRLLAPASVPRTALLLDLSGRRHLSAGTLMIMGHTNDPRATFKDSAVCCLDEIDGINPAAMVRSIVTEYLRWNSPFFKWVPKADDAALRALCSGTFGDVPVPRLGDFVENLPVIQQLLLKISLANIGRPPLLVVGRLDDVTSDDDQSQVLRRLVELGKGQSIIVGCSNRPPADWNIKVVDLSDMSAVPTYSTSGHEASQ